MFVMGWLGQRLLAVRKGLVVVLLGMFCLGGVGSAFAVDEGCEVLKGFTEKQDVTHGVKEIADKRKHQILFYMGIGLLVGILTTVGLGFVLVVFGFVVFFFFLLSVCFCVFFFV